MRSVMAYALLLALAACGDPFGGIERVSEGAALPADPGAAALPSDEELAREGTILGDLLSEENTDAQDAQRSDETPPIATTETATKIDGVPETTGGNPDDVTGIDSKLATGTSAQSRTGVLGWLRRAAENGSASNTTAIVVPAALSAAGTDTAPSDKAIEAALPEPHSDLVEPEKRRGLFGRARLPERAGPDKMDVAVGTVLPFGVIARSCDANPAQMAKVVDKAARKGRGYTLFDSAPETTSPRTFYVTGFADNCPRQFTASLALFGDPVFHEQLRYGLPADEYPYSTTDQAYEKLKRKVCNVERDVPCGDRVDRLSSNTTFISAYENFTDNARWTDMLVHDGKVLASALKTP